MPESHRFHHYLFFGVGSDFYQLPPGEQDDLKREFGRGLESDRLRITTYATLGLKAGTTFMLWCRSDDPADLQRWLCQALRTKLGRYLALSATYFGIIRHSEYSGRTGKPEQVMQTQEERLPYFVLYPFTKTTEWHLLDAEARKAMMAEHIQVGRKHPSIRQCLVYSYGLDDQEFVVSYEMASLEEFQDLVIEMRRTAGRAYTERDVPTYTCLYKKPGELMDWL